MSSSRPIILIATSLGDNSYKTGYTIMLPSEYVTAVIQAGGLPLLVPPMDDGPVRRQIVAQGRGLLVVGGPDLDPASYGQKPHAKTVISPRPRLDADARIVAWADRRRLPTFGICLGIQTLNVHRGGTLIQHVPDHWSDEIEHGAHPPKPRPRHPVRIDPESRLARIVGPQELLTNSSHHQAIATLGRHLRATAWSRDGLIEAVEDDRPDRFFYGVQWHPEELYREKRHLALFQALVRAARRCRT